MITSEREYQITAAEAERVAEALAQAERQATDLDPRLRQAMREGLESQLEDLREQLVEYEKRHYRNRRASLSKQDLIEEVSGKSNLPVKQVQAVVDATFDVIRDAMAKGEKVTLTGFGSFAVAQRRERAGRNPRTGEKVAIGARKAPLFRGSPKLKRAIDAA